MNDFFATSKIEAEAYSIHPDRINYRLYSSTGGKAYLCRRWGVILGLYQTTEPLIVQRLARPRLLGDLVLREKVEGVNGAMWIYPETTYQAEIDPTLWELIPDHWRAGRKFVALRIVSSGHAAHWRKFCESLPFGERQCPR